MTDSSEAMRTWGLSPQAAFGSTDHVVDLRRKSVRSGSLVMSGQGVQAVLQLLTTAALARLLTPEDFGLVAMASVVVSFLSMFKDVGLSAATIQASEVTRDRSSTLFWVNTAVGAGLGLALCAASPLIARFFDEPRLTTVTIALALPFALNCSVIQHQALLRRHMRFRALVITQVTSYVAYAIAAIALAALGWSYWSLVAGSLIMAIASAVMTMAFFPWRPNRLKRRSGALSMIHFGARVTAYDIINYLSRNLDNILVGKVIGSQALGYYSRAYQLFMVPISRIRGPISTVALPALSSLRTQPARYERYYLKLLDVVATVTVPLGVYCALEGGFIVRTLLGPSWDAVVPVFRVLALVGVTQAAVTTTGIVQVSVGDTRRYLRWGVIAAITYSTAFLIGVQFGILGVAIAYAAASYVLLLPSVFYCLGNTPVRPVRALRIIGRSIAVAAIAAVPALLILRLFPNALLTHVLVLAVFALLCCGLALISPHARASLADLRRGLSRESVGVAPGEAEVQACANSRRTGQGP